MLDHASDFRRIRGGCSYAPAVFARSAYSGRYEAGYRSSTLGVRPARGIGP